MTPKEKKYRIPTELQKQAKQDNYKIFMLRGMAANLHTVTHRACSYKEDSVRQDVFDLVNKIKELQKDIDSFVINVAKPINAQRLSALRRKLNGNSNIRTPGESSGDSTAT